jgi:unspecific monooxygenase
VGTLYDYEKDPAGYLESCRDEYGDIFSLTPYHVVVCRPDWSQRILARTGREFQFATNGKSTRQSMMTHQIAAWMHARRTAVRFLAGVGGETMTDRLHAALARLARQPSVTVADCQRAAAEAALPWYVADTGESFLRLVIDANDTIPAITGSSLTLPRWASPARRRWQRATDALVTGLVRRAERHREAPGGGPPPDVLGLLADDPTFSSLEVAQFLAAATGNVHAVAGAGLSWLLAMMGRHPQLAEPSGRDDWALAFVKETLRMYPPIWSVRRQTLEPAESGGYLIPAGMTVVVSPRLMHHDRRWWRSDPAVFHPGRWLDEPPHDPHAYIPYGAGPRVCSGASVAQTILTEAYTMVAASWRVVVLSPEPVAVPAAVVVPDPFRFRLEPR